MIEQRLIDECVHCGFCLPTCPTWTLWQEEMDTPRGRIQLMQGLADGSLTLNSTVLQHFDRCLGCMACVSSCPSGVRYDQLIEQTRELAEQAGVRRVPDRLLRAAILGLFPYPRRLRALLPLAPLARILPLPRSLRPLVSVAPPWRSSALPPRRTAAAGEQPLGRVGLLLGCVQRTVFGDVNVATAEALAAFGYEVVAPRSQGCCGALAVHAGQLEEGSRLARRLIEQLEGSRLDWIVSNASGCGSTLKEYGRLLADDPAWAERAERFACRVRDVSELLAEHRPRLTLSPLPLRVAFQDSCHLAHLQRVRSQPRAVLSMIPGLQLLEPAEQEICCGSAGIYSLVQPQAAAELGRRKAERILATDPDAYASGNPGCLVQVTAHLRAQGRPTPAFHPVELLAASVRGSSVGELLARSRA